MVEAILCVFEIIFDSFKTYNKLYQKELLNAMFS